jgi:hypothetical protein
MDARWTHIVVGEYRGNRSFIDPLNQGCLYSFACSREHQLISAEAPSADPRCHQDELGDRLGDAWL